MLEKNWKKKNWYVSRVIFWYPRVSFVSKIFSQLYVVAVWRSFFKVVCPILEQQKWQRSCRCSVLISNYYKILWMPLRNNKRKLLFLQRIWLEWPSIVSKVKKMEKNFWSSLHLRLVDVEEIFAVENSNGKRKIPPMEKNFKILNIFLIFRNPSQKKITIWKLWICLCLLPPPPEKSSALWSFSLLIDMSPLHIRWWNTRLKNDCIGTMLPTPPLEVLKMPENTFFVITISILIYRERYIEQWESLQSSIAIFCKFLSINRGEMNNMDQKKTQNATTHDRGVQ